MIYRWCATVWLFYTEAYGKLLHHYPSYMVHLASVSLLQVILYQNHPYSGCQVFWYQYIVRDHSLTKLVNYMGLLRDTYHNRTKKLILEQEMRQVRRQKNKEMGQISVKETPVTYIGHTGCSKTNTNFSILIHKWQYEG